VTEKDVIDRLRAIADSPAARGLVDDAALFDGLVITHDSIAEDVHFLGTDPPASVGWKLVAVNLSDLAGKGAEPAAALLSMSLSDPDWDRGLLDGIEAACESYDLDLIGGDTIALPDGATRVYGLTAIGRAGRKTPSRAGGRPSDRLWVAGTIGDSAAGLAILAAAAAAKGHLVDIYRRPIPLLEMGRALAAGASAMMDLSDGLLIDLQKLCEASGCGAEIDLESLPLSSAFVAERGQGREARLFAATGGDDYALLAALPADLDPVSLSLPKAPKLRCIGRLVPGTGLKCTDRDGDVPLPETLGYEHRASTAPVDRRL
jgi:thiamine-monophosphate kinase